MKQPSHPPGSQEEQMQEVLEYYEQQAETPVPDAEPGQQEQGMAGRRSYYCPRCHKLLNPGSSVVFVIEQGELRELMLLSPVPGEYSVIHPPSLGLTLGTLYTFRCPLCNADLTSPADDRLTEIESRNEHGAASSVYFSRMFGERATFVCDSEQVECFGENAMPDELPGR